MHLIWVYTVLVSHLEPETMWSLIWVPSVSISFWSTWHVASDFGLHCLPVFHIGLKCFSISDFETLDTWLLMWVYTFSQYPETCGLWSEYSLSASHIKALKHVASINVPHCWSVSHFGISWHLSIDLDLHCQNPTFEPLTCGLWSGSTLFLSIPFWNFRHVATCLEVHC